MISKNASIKNSVTLKSSLLLRRPWFAGLVFDWMHVNVADAHEQLGNQIRRDASMPVQQVQKLLLMAADGGMTQRQFESTAGRLRPNEASKAGNMGGRLWHHYMHAGSNARMSSRSFSEYLQAFHQAGWITYAQGAEFAKYVVALEIVSSQGDSSPSWHEEFVREFLLKKFPGVSKRVVGSFLKNAKGACETETEYLEFLVELPDRINGLEIFGTNLAHSPLNSDELS